MRSRILIAGLVHETNTFIDRPTKLADFRTLRGVELFTAEGDSSILAGVLAVARTQQWDVLPAIHMDATPGGTVDDAVVETFLHAVEETVTSASPGSITGVWLNFHGAMVSKSFPDVEGMILAHLRRLPACADIPIAMVLDLHGNISQTMAQAADILVAYRENPHTDAQAAAMESARLLDRLLRCGGRATSVCLQVPLLLPPLATATASNPMQTLEAMARQLEAQQPDLLAVSVFSGFSYADVPDAGVSFTASTTGELAAASAALELLAAAAREMREAALPIGIELADALDQVQGHESGPIVLVESSDNIGGGAPGDLTIVLRGLIERNISGAGVIINDPDAVTALQNWSYGQRGSLVIGGRSGELGAVPLPLYVELLSRSDGQYTLEDRHSHNAGSGLQAEMGACAVVRAKGVTLLLTSRRTAPFDLAQWRSQGIDPETFFVVAVKAAVAHRQAYDPIAKASYILNTPGPCANDLRILAYLNLRRPMYPLDVI